MKNDSIDQKLIRPMSAKNGMGFCSSQPIDVDPNTYRYEHSGYYHNYHFTPDSWRWPKPAWEACHKYLLIDSFSPNLNKHLHIGHLRQLALAKSFSELYPSAKFVALYGASQGVYDYALEGLEKWKGFLSYKPKEYYDVLLPCENHFLPATMKRGEVMSKYFGCTIWDGPQGPVVLVRSKGTRTYAAHDLVFAKKVGPTHYLTGSEQKTHFESLGLADRHLSMGLVLGSDGKKCKSRTGDTMTAEDALNTLQSALKETPSPRELAWNILAWNFLSVGRSQDIKFDPENWCKPDKGGLYISYTYARLYSAMVKAGCETCFDFQPTIGDYNETDMKILAQCSYLTHFEWLSRQNFDPTSVAQNLFRLAAVVNEQYAKERIVDGRPDFISVLWHARSTMKKYMRMLGMFPLAEV